MREKNGFVVRILAVLLAFAMMLQPLPVFADGPEDTEQTAVETTAEEEIPEEPEAPETEAPVVQEEPETEAPETEAPETEAPEEPEEPEAPEEPETEAPEEISIPAETQAPVLHKEKKKDAAVVKPTEADTDAAASEPETEPESEPESEPETEAGEAAVPADGAAPAVPKLTAAENTADGIKITWEAVPDAETYNVYRKKASDKWSGKKFFTTDKTEYLDQDKLTVGTEYSYTVRAVKGGELSDYDEKGVTATAVPEQPVMKEPVSVSETGLKLSWEATKDTDYYHVYRQRDDGTWTKIGKKITATSFTDESAPKAKETVYTVRSCKEVNKKEVLSVYEEVITGKTLTAEEKESTFVSPKLKKAKGVNTKTIQVTWGKAPEAEGYYVYRKKGSGKWKKLAAVAGANTLSYTDKKCKFGKKYTYTVRAYRKYGSVILRSTGYNEKGITGTPKLAKPSLKAAQPTSNRKGIRVTWKAVSGAKGYKIYRKKAGKKTWKLLKTLGKVTEYTDKTVKGNKRYTYTVRAYVKVGGKILLSKYNKKGVTSSTKITSKKVDGLILYYDDNGRVIKDVEGIIGKQSSYRIEIDYDKNIVTVYAKSSSGSYNVPVKAFVCSTGKATPIGTFSTPAKYRWRTLQGPCYGQWCTRIHGGVLFHSVPYYTQSNNNLKVYAYNKLGTKCSAGCIRLCCRDAKWIYDNCKLGTKVTIKHNARNPFGKPSALKLKSGHTWDPTDPNMAYKCRDKGCH
ncbi:MAG: fibronectin type III domain-containing protein [Lachnospiraceae bacterium]|nr:fibronectin type III domain-containing protein [Lachnospiraceae bacterium]